MRLIWRSKLRRAWLQPVATGVLTAGLLAAELLAAAALWPCTSAQAQQEQTAASGEAAAEEDEIETDRDSFTPATTTAGRGRIITEAAYSFIDNRSVPETHSYPELLLRGGLGEFLELRLGWNYEVGGASNPVSGNVPDIDEEAAALEREHRILYGLKARLFEQNAWFPASAVIVQGYTPTGGEATATDVSVGAVSGWTFANRWVLDTAMRYSTANGDEDQFNVWAPSIVLKAPVGERWKAHVEYFGVFSSHRADETVQNFASPGAHYLVTPNLEVGARLGWGLNSESPHFFSNAGVGWRY